MVHFATHYTTAAALLVREEGASYGMDASAPSAEGAAEAAASPAEAAASRFAPAAKPDPEPADPDALEELGDRITTLAAHIHAADYRLLALLADFDRQRGWTLDGQRSCAGHPPPEAVSRLAFRTGIDLGAAREKVRVCRALEELPLISASMEQSQL